MDITLSNGHHDNHLTTSTQYVFHEAISTRLSLPGVEDSEDELSSSRPDDKFCLTSPQTSNDVSKKYSIGDVTNEKVFNLSLDTKVNEKAFRKSSAIELNNSQDCYLVSFETREGKAKRNKHFIPSTGTLVCRQHFVWKEFLKLRLYFHSPECFYTTKYLSETNRRPFKETPSLKLINIQVFTVKAARILERRIIIFPCLELEKKMEKYFLIIYIC